MKKSDYDALCETAWEHNRRYYVEHSPVISDEEFDRLLKQIESIEKEYPNWISSASPTQRVGEETTEGFKTAEHSVPMLSLANTYSRDEIEEFIKRVERLEGKGGHVFCCELKMDGVAISCRYENGLFVQAVTRGNGREGDVITANMRTLHSLPLKLYGDDVPDVLEVRGEVYMPRDVFTRLNKTRKDRGDEPWANPRNAAAGSLKLIDPKEVNRRGLAVKFYAIAECDGLPVTSQFETHEYLRRHGLPILAEIERCHSLGAIWAFTEKVKRLRQDLAYDIDGIVIKADSLASQKKMGATGKNPRWAVAYKFAAEQSETVIEDISVQVGRSGVLTPVAELTPVFLVGSTISRATLHNQDEIDRKDIRIGDTVLIEKGGDVIPKVAAVVHDKRPEGTQKWHAPKQCPSCGTDTVNIEGEVAIRCPNSESCPAQNLRSLIYFASKQGMDIEHLGEKVVEQLVSLGFVKRPSDFFALTPEQLSHLEGFKEKSISNLLGSIDASKKVPLARFIMALGIKFVGAGTAELIARKVGTIEGLKTVTYGQLIAIDGIGEKVAESVVDFFDDPDTLDEVDRLLELGVAPQAERVISYTDHPFTGKTFVLTGSLENFTRQSASSLIKERGGKVTSSVSRKTDYVLAGEDPGSKRDKAEKLGVAIIDEAKFQSLL